MNCKINLVCSTLILKKKQINRTIENDRKETMM